MWKISARYLTIGISDLPVEFFASQDNIFCKTSFLRYDATFYSNRPCRINVIAGDHPDNDACLLTLLDGCWNFVSHWVFDPENGKTSQPVN